MERRCKNQWAKSIGIRLGIQSKVELVKNQ